tara:strand:+ start:57 stop:380 length:324 start_codon:yes stop_codon:yes gene_type:complete
LRAFVFITPREEEGVFKVVFQSACVQTLRARKRKGDCTAEEARDQKKERKCLGFICYPKYWRNFCKHKDLLQKKEAAKGFVLLFVHLSWSSSYENEDEENHLQLKQR